MMPRISAEIISVAVWSNKSYLVVDVRGREDGEERKLFCAESQRCRS